MSSAATRLAPPSRPAQIVVANPVRIDPAVDDPEALMDLIRDRAPYNLVYSKDGYEKAGGAEPWFRYFWYKNGQALVPEAQPFFENERFIEASKQAFDAEVIRPQTLFMNVSAPMQPGRPHFDLCRFRGISEANNPLWLHTAMHHSQLFMHWAILQSTALVWFFPGPGGGYQYWANGPYEASETVESPLWNVGLVTDNDFMFHRAEGVGRQDRWIAPRTIGGDSKLHLTPEGRWQIRDDKRLFYTFNEASLRFFVIWKALVFKTAADAEAYDNHTDDLALDQVWDMFAEDFASRGEKLDIPADPLKDRLFREKLLTAYPPPGKLYFEEARREGDR